MVCNDILLYLKQLRYDPISCMDLSDGVQGNVLVIHGGIKPEVKFVSTEKFTKCINNPQLLLDMDKYYP